MLFNFINTTKRTTTPPSVHFICTVVFTIRVDFLTKTAEATAKRNTFLESPTHFTSTCKESRDYHMKIKVQWFPRMGPTPKLPHMLTSSDCAGLRNTSVCPKNGSFVRKPQFRTACVFASSSAERNARSLFLLPLLPVAWSIRWCSFQTNLADSLRVARVR